MKELYGVMKDGKKVSKYIIENANGFRAEFLDMGAILDKLFVPDKDGNLVSSRPATRDELPKNMYSILRDKQAM